VTAGKRMTGGHASEVCRCVTRDGADAVLKLPPTRAAAAVEAAALRLWQASGVAVILLADDPDCGALVLELLTPGTPLGPGDCAGAVAVAASALRLLHRRPPPGIFPQLMQQYDAAERRSWRDASHEVEVLRRSAPPGAALLPLARIAAEQLSRSAPNTVLLHGDFIDKNLLRHHQRYIAIDPMPVTGDPGYDIGLFAACHPPAHSALATATDLAHALRYPADRARRWTAAWLCHQACESWRADSAQLFSLVTDSAVLSLLQP